MDTFAGGGAGLAFLPKMQAVVDQLMARQTTRLRLREIEKSRFVKFALLIRPPGIRSGMEFRLRLG